MYMFADTITWVRVVQSLPPSCLPPALGLAVQSLGEAAAYFSMLDCKERLRDVHYLQARLHHTLGQTPQRNKCAMLFRLLDQELQAPGAAVAMRL